MSPEPEMVTTLDQTVECLSCGWCSTRVAVRDGDEYDGRRKTMAEAFAHKYATGHTEYAYCPRGRFVL